MNISTSTGKFNHFRQPLRPGFFAYSQMQGSQAESTAWDHLDKNDPSALRVFLDHTGSGDLHDRAQVALTNLEQQRWTQARTADTIEAYNGFITYFPHSEHMLEARGRIAELQSAPSTTTTAIDPLTGMPTVQPDPDLVPPGTTATTTDTTTTTTTQQPIGPGGPVSLTPPPSSNPNPQQN